MTKKLMCIALTALVGVTAVNAQNKDTNVPARKAHFAKDGAGSHWFLEVGNSASFHFSGMNFRDAGDHVKGISFLNPSIAVGRWHNPYFATRLQASWLNVKDRFKYREDSKFALGEHQYLAGQLQFMFDVTNFFGKYRENRFFHFIPFVGVGAATNLSSEYSDIAVAPAHKVGRFTPLATGGVQLKFRLGRAVDFNLEGQITAKNTRLHSELEPLTRVSSARPLAYKQSFLASVGASLTFHLGKKEFTPVTRQDDQLLADLNNQLNALRAENAELRKRPVSCPEAPAPQHISGVTVGNVIYFRINSATVDPNQLINIRNIAEYAKNNTETITLVGYADRETGTPEYNYKLSERRAEAVKAILVKKHGISADRIKTSWEGDRVQPYAENVWNRIVIMNAE